MQTLYRPPDINNWQGRNSDDQLYVHENIRMLNLDGVWKGEINKGDIVLLGYSCDEGVRRNSGRPGAANGYHACISELGKLPHPKKNVFQVYDAGSVLCKDGQLEESQEELGKRVADIVGAGARPILIGGGHEIAYGHYSGLRKLSPAIINLDAHFDLRIPSPLPNSGTPFYQIAMDNKNEEKNFEYLVLGIRKDANDRSLFTTAAELGVRFIENTSLHNADELQLDQIFEDFIGRQNHIYLTIDLDVFSSAYAPGVSAASPFGIDPDTGLKIISKILASKKVCSIDVAELNPKFDQDSQTAKLAAGIVRYAMEHWTYSSQDL